MATLVSTAISPSVGAVAGGTHSDVTRTARIPAAASWAIFCRATAGSSWRTMSSAAPNAICGPSGLCGGRADEDVRARARGRRRRIVGRATLAVVVDQIRKDLGRLPLGPGVYLFRDEHDEVLYIGKAKSLRSRVRTYFNKGDARPGIGELVRRIARFEVIVTQSEAEALHLEQNLVKRHRPPFNVRLRDDKSFPYIAVTVSDEYPRVMFTRERHRRGTVYFGPYANAKKVPRDARRPQPGVPVPAVRGPEAGPSLGHPLPRLPHRALHGAVHPGDLAGGLPRTDRRRDRVPLGRDADDRP